MKKFCRECLAVVKSHKGLYNFSMTSKSKVTAGPKNSMKKLASEIKLATETVESAVTAVIYAKILCQHTNVPFD